MCTCEGMSLLSTVVVVVVGVVVVSLMARAPTMPAACSSSTMLAAGISLLVLGYIFGGFFVGVFLGLMLAERFFFIMYMYLKESSLFFPAGGREGMVGQEASRNCADWNYVLSESQSNC